jgi:hypothetical protein
MKKIRVREIISFDNVQLPQALRKTHSYQEINSITQQDQMSPIVDQYSQTRIDRFSYNKRID